MQHFFGSTPIYVIHLADSIDRETHIRDQFGDYAHYKFIEAIDGRNSELFRSQYTVTYNDSNKKFTTGLIAVICSHIRAIYTAFQEGHEKVVIVEDDVWTDLLSTCDFTLETVCKLRSDWEIIQLGYEEQDHILKGFYDFKQHGLKLIPRTYNLSETCYVINRAGMYRFLNEVGSYDGNTTFVIHPQIVDVENLMMGYLKSYYTNRVILYYYFSTMTFDKYFETESDSKKLCQSIHSQAQQFLRSLYSDGIFQNSLGYRISSAIHQTRLDPYLKDVKCAYGSGNKYAIVTPVVLALYRRDHQLILPAGYKNFNYNFGDSALNSVKQLMIATNTNIYFIRETDTSAYTIDL